MKQVAAMGACAGSHQRSKLTNATAAWRTRTPQLRRLMLHPVELRGQPRERRKRRIKLTDGDTQHRPEKWLAVRLKLRSAQSAMKRR